VIQGRGVDADHDLVRPGNRIRIVLHQLEDLGPAVLRARTTGLQRTTCATPANEAVLDKGRRQRTLYPFCWRRRTTSLRWSPCRDDYALLPGSASRESLLSSLASFSASSGFDSRPQHDGHGLSIPARVHLDGQLGRLATQVFADADLLRQPASRADPRDSAASDGFSFVRRKSFSRR